MVEQVTPEVLHEKYQQAVAKVRADESLSWEQKEREVRRLGLRLDRQLRRELEAES